MSSIRDGVMMAETIAAIDPILRGECLQWLENASIRDIQWIYIEILCREFAKNNNRMQDEA